MEFISKKIEDIVLSIKTGKTPSTKESLYFDGNIPFVTPGDLKGQMFILSSERTLTGLAVIEKQAFLHTSNTVLISTIGENIAKVAVVKKPVASNQQITGINVNNKIILPHFFYYWVYLNKKLLKFKANRATIPILNNKSLKSLSIKFPKSLEFQRKIVESLNLIQSSIDNRIEMIEVINKLSKSIYHREFGDPVNNQNKYPLKKLNQIVKKDKGITYGIVQAGPHIENGVPYLRSGDIKNGAINISTQLKTSEKISEKYNRTICAEGDVLLTIRANVGDVAYISKEFVGYNLTRGIAILSTNKELINPSFLYYTLLSSGFQFLLDKQLKGATFKEISLIKLREIKIPVPDLKLQNDFSIIVKQLDELRNQMEESLSLMKALFQSVLQNAFKEGTVIDEEPIFKELIKKFTFEDLKGNKKRLQFLIDLFDSKKFDDLKDYSNAKEKLFQLIEEDEIIQELTDNNLKLQVK
ncbi:restriction endonuclease subunit S [Flavivirga abyssicola]|uniref:restriction endonuclease subunit S n=1 Tax=Flavivirga abyssicola TaxID=3063533 RepID=UPI0026E0A6FE|nr:restriction endonuclease subunit S [Flavivirga sp. MEBiC07777]WVK13829.1 restriction endonuclease subunit S [Flavivirga sp. MEBiC07777]